jgi:hypothetical protein
MHLKWVQTLCHWISNKEIPSHAAQHGIKVETENFTRNLSKRVPSTELLKQPHSHSHTHTHSRILSLIRLIVSTQRGKREVGVQGLTAISWPQKINYSPPMAGGSVCALISADYGARECSWRHTPLAIVILNKHAQLWASERERGLRPLWNHETIGYAKFGLMEFATFAGCRAYTGAHVNAAHGSERLDF